MNKLGLRAKWAEWDWPVVIAGVTQLEGAAMTFGDDDAPSRLAWRRAEAPGHIRKLRTTSMISSRKVHQG